MKNLFIDVKFAPVISFNEFSAKRPYKPTNAFTKAEWEEGLHAAYMEKFGVNSHIKDYTCVLNNGQTLYVKAANYMNAKLTCCKTYGVKREDIKSVF